MICLYFLYRSDCSPTQYLCSIVQCANTVWTIGQMLTDTILYIERLLKTQCTCPEGGNLHRGKNVCSVISSILHVCSMTSCMTHVCSVISNITHVFSVMSSIVHICNMISCMTHVCSVISNIIYTYSVMSSCYMYAIQYLV